MLIYMWLGSLTEAGVGLCFRVRGMPRCPGLNFRLLDGSCNDVDVKWGGDGAG